MNDSDIISNEIECRHTKDGKHYIPNKSAIREIVSHLAESCITILGPRHCQKSLLLEDVKGELERNSGSTCILVDLLKAKRVDDSDFLRKFAAYVEQPEMQEHDNQSLSSRVVDESSLEEFLVQYVQQLCRDVVLLLDHLECMHIDPLESLLRVLTAVHTKQEGAAHKLRVITASASSVAQMPREGSSSFFDISRPIWIGDLTQDESNKLIDCIVRNRKARITPAAKERLISATNRDRYLIPILSDYCASLMSTRQIKEIGEQDIEQSIIWFVDHEAKRYPPLRGNMRAVVSDTVTLMNVLKVLEHKRVPHDDLMLDLEGDVYKLLLTGVIRVEDKRGKKDYLIRNDVYERFLKDYFSAERLKHIISLAGQWKRATRYLPRLIAYYPEFRSTLLSKVVDSIYAAEDETKACDYLVQQFSHLFLATNARIYIVNPVRSHLELISQVGFENKSTERLSLDEEERNEVKAYISQDYVLTHNDSGTNTVMVPLLRNDEMPLGVVVIYGFEADVHGKDFFELLDYLKQAGRAVGNVIERQRKLLQLAKLNETGKNVTSSLDSESAMKATVVGAIEAVPGAQRCALFMWNEEKKLLFIEAYERPELFTPNIREEIILVKGEGYAGTVYETGKPLLIGNVAEHPIVRFRDHPNIKEQKSVMCVPLEAWGRVMGVLFVDNTAAYNAFQERDVQLLSTFAAQAATALNNAQLYTELHKLGLSINRGDLSIREIFQHTVQSITRVSAAKAAHMLLLRDIDDTSLSLAEKIVLSESVGLGDDYDKKLRPRPNGLTARVIRTGKYCAVSGPNHELGINKLSRKHGVIAYVCLPMEVQKRIIGVLFVYHDREHEFTENEIEMLSLFTNQAALAIENTRQRKKLEIMEAVAWMGIEFSDMAHEIDGKVAACKREINYLLSAISDSPKIIEAIKDLKEYNEEIGKIPRRTLLPFRPKPDVVPFNKALRKEIEKWIPPEENVNLTFSGQKNAHIKVYINYQLLGVVLKILTNNAVRATRSTADKRLSIKVTTKSDRVVVTMSNGGRAIPLKIQKRLFKEPISKSQGASGTGVGLLIANSILLGSGGEIEFVKSNDDETVFSFHLPLLTPERPDEVETEKALL